MSKRRDLSHTARCLDCGMWNEYAADGTLIIWHAGNCPNRPRRGDK